MSGLQLTKSQGATATERYLRRLCDRSFLSLWSYPGVYRDQGRLGKSEDGKEICDLLVVFEEHVLIFSDKDCTFPDSGDLDLDWSRWYRRAVEGSAKQVWGAERWIRSHPDRIFLDRACTRPFPIDLPDPSIAKFHRIVVAHAASARCKRELGGSGSLMIMPDIIGPMHCARPEDGGMPFAVGHVDPTKGYVHVLDDTSLDILMTKLDTITDFVSYLSKKERFIASGRLGAATGEEDLLAWYLRELNEDEEHDFVVAAGHDHVLVTEGLWEDFISHPQRSAQFAADQVSYAWDELIETFSRHIFANTEYFTTHTEIREREKIFRFMAREPRTRRRMLARLLLELLHLTPRRNMRATRVVLSSRPGDPYYVFLLLPESKTVPYDEYRKIRREFLYALCMAVKLKFPAAEDIIGIATETGINANNRSEDAVYYNAREWSDSDRAEAERVSTDLGLLQDLKLSRGTEREYPDLPAGRVHGVESIPVARMKGRTRNAPCPCGSGKKQKKCCG